MAVAKNDSGTAKVDSAAATVTSLDLTTFTVSAGSNLALIAFFAYRTAISNLTLTWDNGGSNQAMTEIGSGASNTNIIVRLFKLANPATGNLTLHSAWTTAAISCLGAIAFSGADQSTVIATGDTVTNTGTGTAATTGAITSTTDGATVGWVGNSANLITSTDTQTSIFTVTQNFNRAGASYGLGGTSNTHSWTLSGSVQWAAIGAHILAAASGGGPLISGGELTRGALIRGGRLVNSIRPATEEYALEHGIYQRERLVRAA